MPRYFFDLRDGDNLAVDEEGMELRSMEAVLEEAAHSLADMARDAVRRLHRHDSRNHRMAVDVRDANSRVIEVKFTVEISTKK